MRQILNGRVVIGLSALIGIGGMGVMSASAVPTVVGIPAPNHDPDPTDAFENATITSASSPTMGSYTSNNGDVFGGTLTTYPTETGNLIFSGVPGVATLFLEFQTASPVNLVGYHLYAGHPNSPDTRMMTNFALFARATPGAFVVSDLVSTTPIHYPYSDAIANGGYGSNTIQVSDAFPASFSQYFRFEVVTHDSDDNGTRLIELDAVTGPVPEPASLAFTLGLLAIASRRRVC